MSRERILISSVTFLISWVTVSSVQSNPIIQAAVGEPFGVARVTLQLDSREASGPISTNGYTIAESNGRIFYPAFGHTRVLSALRQLIGMQSPAPRSTVSVFFLFKGDSPFQATIMTPVKNTVVIVPKDDDALFRQLQKNWWSQYVAVAALNRSLNDYPAVMETYLTSMLSRRLDLNSNSIGDLENQHDSIPQMSLLLILNSESTRVRAMKQSLMKPTLVGTRADQKLPAKIDWAASHATKLQSVGRDSETKVEPIALRVPQDCFYIRYGNFKNYLWMKEFLEQNGGSVKRTLTLRGQDSSSAERIQDQLGLKESSLATILGPQLISDIAMIGHDTYLREGASIGVLFESRSRQVLEAELIKQRSNAVQKRRNSNATIKNIKIDNHTVSIATTPDNRLRSFYISIGNYHLVTNTRKLVQEFIETQAGKRASLGETAAFLLARSHHPASEKATLFAYVPPSFFHNLVSPHYQIELRRRLNADVQLELVRMAKLAASHEQLPHESIEDLRFTGLLPAHFGERPDESRIEGHADQLVDSLRGARGTFLPIPDVPLEKVTTEEVRVYQNSSDRHKSTWKNIAPMVMVLRRKPLKNGREQLVIDAEMAPFERDDYPRVTSVIGPPTKSVVKQSRQDAITIQASLQGGAFRPDINSHQIFFGMQDKDVPVKFAGLRRLRAMQIIRTAPAYLGSHPTIGFLQALPLGNTPLPDQDGLTRLPFGVWQKTEGKKFSMFAFRRTILTAEMPELSFATDKHEAQLRIHVDDLTQSKLKNWIAALDFQRAYQASIGNTRLLHTVSQQFGVPPNEAREAAESVLGVHLICALGGEYDRVRDATGVDYWSSTRWPERLTEGESVEPSFVSPILSWFRGLDARLTLGESRVTGFAQVEIQEPKREKGPLNFLNLFQ